MREGLAHGLCLGNSFFAVVHAHPEEWSECGVGQNVDALHSRSSASALWLSRAPETRPVIGGTLEVRGKREQIQRSNRMR